MRVYSVYKTTEGVKTTEMLLVLFLGAKKYYVIKAYVTV